ncbi:MAG TPA: cyclic nucleotide-binding domain-containing protein [Solimonas sp.]|nr:cyclic nucleotide-binding domain-containing protein [Solimonas sp.]
MNFQWTPDLFVHIGYALMLVALLARDILWLRAVLVCAQSNLALYAWTHGLVGMTAWNSLFVLINALWVMRILRERREVQLPPELEAIHHAHFAAFSAGEFLRFWNQGQARAAQGRLVDCGRHPPELLYLVEGVALVRREGRELARLPAGSFIAEMSLLTGEPTTADVDSLGAVQLRAWPVAGLQEMRAQQPLQWTRLQSVLGHDLVEKLKRAAPVAEAEAIPAVP